MGVEPSRANWFGSRNPDVAAITQHPASSRAVQGIMELFLTAGVAGIALHYQSSMDFKLQTNPSLSGRGAVWDCHVCENTAGPGTGDHDSAGTARACVHLPSPIHRQPN